MYSDKKKEIALNLLKETKSVTKTIRILGYPSRVQLYSWVNLKDELPKIRKQLARIGNPPEHPRNPSMKIKLNALKRCYDGLIVTWEISQSPNSNLVNSMLDNAINLLLPNEKPILHTDRGVHYRWTGWIERMDKAKLIRSMSKKGCSADNSACEGLFGRLKNEMFYNRDWVDISIPDFINILNSYIVWYNEKRIKKSLGYMSPMEYRRSLGLAA